MRVPLEWLKEYVAIRLTPHALAERLTMAGLEVTGIEQIDEETVFDIEVTPNRADCLSIIGVAREVAAITGQRLKLPQAAGGGRRGKRGGKSPRPTPHAPRPVIRIEDRHGCTHYIGRLLTGVTIGPSPEWMQRRLIACGTRPINNVVDVTNYVLFEYGQPLHAFDFTRLAHGTILVRAARPKESMTTLDGVSRTLPVETLVIADAKRSVAVAGIMGGVGSEVTQATTDVLLESARFDPSTIRRTARKLGLASESSYRFERGVDPLGVEVASARAAELIQSLAGGLEAARCDAGGLAMKRTAILLDPTRLTRWLGTPIDNTTIRTTLARLSCRVASSGARGPLHVTPPSFRQDLRHEVDLYEELARFVGYDRLPTHVPSASMIGTRSEEALAYARRQSLRCVCASLGLIETINWSLIAESEITRIGLRPTDAVRLVNPLSQDHAYLRPTLLVGLLQAVRRNLTQGSAAVRFFELGSVVQPADGIERVRLGMVLAGWWSRDWQGRIPCDFFRLKGVLQALTTRLCHGTLQLVNARATWAEPGEETEVRLNGRSLGVAGQVAESITAALDLEQKVWFAELAVEELIAARRVAVTISAPAVFPPVKRDLSLVVAAQTPCEAVERTIRESAGVLASHVELIDRYTGKPIPSGKCGLTFSIEYRDPTRTLTATEVDGVHQRIGQTLASRFGATLR